MEQLKRVISAAIILPPLLLFLYYAPPFLFLGLILLVAWLSMREYSHMLTESHLPVFVRSSYLVTLLLVLTAYLGGERWLSRVLFVSVAALAACALTMPHNGSQRLPALLYSVFGVLFIGWSLSHLILLRHFAAGKWYVFFLCTIVWAGDSVAMYVGKCLGHHKMAPAISPGKTWEGALGGLMGGVGAAGLSARVFLPSLTVWQGLGLGLLVACTAQVSDLSESLIKRHVGVKDSGELIPGHGGVLDRIDSLLFAAPVLVYALDFILQAPAL
jgi:phosphatidate cytidylyltransferase